MNNLAALAAMVLVTSCAADARDDLRLDPTPAVPVPIAAPSSPPPVLQLPDDLELPHSAKARRLGAGTLLYNYVCLSPPTELQDTTTDDGRAVGFEDAAGYTIERLALYYSSAAVAAEAMEDLRGELRLCADSLDHVGNPYGYRTLAAPEVPHADETLQWHTLGVEPPQAFVTVARLGKVVYFVDHRTEAPLAKPGVLSREAARGEKAVASFALELCLWGFGKGCQELPG